MDDTGQNEYPLMYMNLKNIILDNRTYEDVDSASEMLLKKLGIMDKKNSEEEPYLYSLGKVNLEIQYFNK
jgi:hypothetical protein